ncbi:MAG: 2-hydroxy-6-oxo-6-phenylhexa-2,4-dienoate hydrolase [candidate division WS6 bacterium OLB21]|uniref:2-hydroxy-6-oxo-6-phenylhexa-2,4-dienoate hydrolase n=1 Tax=candidate division WS6 bacterium OLB21 TaxID=1617427 RepID=A0A136KGY7_9BACT|nr:MAG: 2-hydroxy-6-oxo-6-phenylhexa-2,4-dienoate hydrolase [candidate division WS6 bacterium OLB21]
MQNAYLLPVYTDKEDFKLFTEKKIKTHSFEINYAEAGQGETLLLVHGMSNNWTGWIPLAKILKDYFRVVLIDLPGYGKSQRLEKYSVEIQAQALEEFISKLDLKVTSIVGLSMGSIVIAEFLSNYADKVDSAVLCGPMFHLRNAEWASWISNKGLWAVDKTKGASTVLKTPYH